MTTSPRPPGHLPATMALRHACQLGLLVLGGPVLAQDAAPAAPPVVQDVQVIGTAPLPGQGVSRDALPYATQVLRRRQIEASQPDTLTDLLAQRLPGVQVNEVQGSPFQGDLTYRGYRASGLIGAAQGLSVYLDGVRANEPFGDVVNWDMIPEFSLDSVSLLPGANPAFGLNTLGGALSLRTATGASAPGLRGEASVGSFGRRKLALSHGAADAQSGWQHYIAVSGFSEDGWRDHSDGHLGTLLAKASQRLGPGELSLGLLHGRSRLVGNGLVPLVTLDEDGQRTADLGSLRNSAVYTHPDLTRNRLTQLTLGWQQDLAGGQRLEALAWHRLSDRDTVNGDESDAEQPDPAANASLNRTRTHQRGAGLALGLSGRQAAHQWQLGASFEQARMRYTQTEQEGVFDATRGVQPLDEDAELSAHVAGRSRSLGLHGSDTWQLQPGTHLTAALRLNHSRVSNQLDTVDDDTGVLENKPRESFSYRSLNPALGLAQRLDALPGVTLFGNLARSTRVPTVIELGCADPQEPCRLPAGLQADPYLKQVKSTTLEAGARFGQPDGWRGSVALYRSDNRDDILFSSVSVNGQLGYFRNFDRTRHEGLDLALARRWGTLETSLAYSHLRASYQSEGVIRQGERNVAIRPGMAIAGLPRNQLKLGLDWQAGADWQLGLDWQLVGRRGVSGNEDHRLEDDGDTGHDLSLPGYGLVHLRASWTPASLSGLELFAKVSNLLDKRYASFGALAETQFDAAGQWTGEAREALFVAPGAPRAFTLGARLAF